ncbi:phosphomannomutase, putative [Trypanosoma equiperdum]|uniref:Phosphomannomutase n=3 Tax=Trypanozoon TaxID=39700 RepID=Q38AW2_TRYB2|nr:phosphomannomutase, putative [Trypanosoma brucei brucei TREU927]EAN78058.1 phosphomannomutase, putative [Trypanosoma brucei brucei TREU927]CCA64422.1 phosphomannomutase [Trypanosoma brucei]SCU73209.1 phosphomannomutase, putative [Trypanosoma equiperdum]
MKRVLLLFDVDGTLTPPRLCQTDEMRALIKRARGAGFCVGTVGGSDFAKQVEQLGRDVLTQFDYVFAENGLLAYRNGLEIHRQSLLNALGNDRIVKFVKKTLRLIADLDIPVQRGTFVEYRNGMINVSPIGRNCSQAERDEFEVYDNEHRVRASLIAELENSFPDFGLKYSIGGQISFDVFPVGWDKTYCLQFVEDDFEEIHFFGDKTQEGGNDYEIYTDKRTIGHKVTSYKDTIAEVEKIIAMK